MPLTLSGTNGVSGVDGTASNPALKGGTSSTAGVVYPAADTVAIATTSTERLRVDSSGNIVIGGTIANARLDVQGGLLRVNEDGAGTKVIQLRSNWAGVDPAIQVATNNSLLFVVNGNERARIDSSGNLLVTGGGGLGYGTGSGGTVTQATSKTTGVTINKTVGQITTAADALGAGATAAFTVTNSTFAAVDCVVLNSQNINYSVRISDNAAGSFKITIKNESAGSLSQAVVINFAVIKGATS